MGSGLEGIGFSFEREWVGVSVYGNRSGFICFYTLWTRKTGDETAGGMLAPAFTLRTYVYFLILAFLLTFCGWEIYRRVSGRRVTIPLVSGMGVMYMVFLTIRF